jgi:hypothetical protein
MRQHMPTADDGFCRLNDFLVIYQGLLPDANGDVVRNVVAER